MKNYIEVENKYTDEDGAVNVDVYCAVRPTPNWIEDERYDDSKILAFLTPWVLAPGEWNIRLYDRVEIAGLRKLLDAIEAEMEGEGR